MKKNGFTLAEVLITLTIIGVVATLTLPALMSNTQEQQAITAFRKSMNTLNEVAQMNSAVDGFDYGGISTQAVPNAAGVTIYNETNGTLTQSIWAMMSVRAQVDPTRSGAANTVYGSQALAGACAGFNAIAFRDGTMLCYDNVVTNANAQAVINAVVDTNGIKAPNAVSTCTGEACNNSQRVINDQFEITLYNSTAIPGRVTVNAQGTFVDVAADANANNASRWAMSK